MTPTQLTLRELRRRGFQCEVVEHFVRFPPPGHRKDLFGCIDVLAVLPTATCEHCFGRGRCDVNATTTVTCGACEGVGGVTGFTLGVQACRRADVQNRWRKMQEEPRAFVAVDAGWHIEVWGWGKLKESGARWVVRRVPFVAELAALPACRAGVK